MSCHLMCMCSAQNSGACVSPGTRGTTKAVLCYVLGEVEEAYLRMLTLHVGQARKCERCREERRVAFSRSVFHAFLFRLPFLFLCPVRCTCLADTQGELRYFPFIHEEMRPESEKRECVVTSVRLPLLTAMLSAVDEMFQVYWNHRWVPFGSVRE